MNISKSRAVAAIMLLACTVAPAPDASAVVVAKDNSSIYTQPPTVDDFGFGSVGIVFAGIPAAGIYLGEGWVLSAYHNVTDGANGFTFNGVVFGGLGYSVDPLTATRLHNPDTSLADLAMFRLTTTPENVPAVSLSGVTATAETAVRMMGNGQDRALSETHWLAIGNSWTESTTGGNRTGYKLIGTRGLRWGNNTIEQHLGLVSGAFGSIVAFSMDFDGVAGEAMATGGDSGGGVFAKTSGLWELTGVMIATQPPFPGQPAGTVVYGNGTIAADVSAYRTEILATMAAIPEPSSAALLLLSGAALIRRRRVR